MLQPGDRLYLYPLARAAFTYYAPRYGLSNVDTIVCGDAPGMRPWRKKLFLAMANTATNPVDVFGLPEHRIVTIGSVAAFNGRTNGSIYAVAKAGMTHYTRCLADQLRPYDIAVNCIAPGDTRTGRFLGTRAVDQNRMVEEGTLDRIATVDEVARVVEFFAGPMGAFVSGQVLRIDGGGQAWPG